MSMTDPRSVEREAQRILEAASEALQRGELGIDEFDAIGQLVDGAQSAFIEGEIEKQLALEKLNQAERHFQEAL